MYFNEPIKNENRSPSHDPVKSNQILLHSTLKKHPLQQFQKTIGNQATRHYIQRMITNEEKKEGNIKDLQQPYDTIFDTLKNIKNSLIPEDQEIVTELDEMKKAYDTAKTVLEKLQLADQMSVKSYKFSTQYDNELISKNLVEIKRVLTKFPHVVLGKDETISLNDLLTTIGTIDKEDIREIGLIRLQNNKTQSERMGLFLGPLTPSNPDVGANVTAPGPSSFGFKDYTSNFIAHTHPRGKGANSNTELKAHKHELKADILGAKSMEIVKATSGETLFYNQNGPKNDLVADRLKFANTLQKPKNTINSFTELPSHKRYISKNPTPDTKLIYKDKAKSEETNIWSRILELQSYIKEEQLTVSQFNLALSEMQEHYNKLENHTLSTFEEWEKEFPTENIPIDPNDTDPFDFM